MAKVPDNLAEIGHSGLRHFRGFVKEDFLTKLQSPQAQKRYREMADNDATIGGILFAIESIIMQAGWQVVRGGNSAKDDEVAQFLRSNMNDMSHTWESFIVEVLSMLRYGWSFFEIVYKLRNGKSRSSRFNSKFKDGRFGWRKIALRGQETLHRWEIDDNGGIQGMWQLTNFINVQTIGVQPVFLPIEKSILFRTRHDKNNPEGRAITRNAYRAYTIKKVLEELEAIRVERDLVGFPTLHPPNDLDLNSTDNSSVKTWAQDLITHIRRDQQEGALLPPGWILELIPSPGRHQLDITAMINRWDQRIAMSMLGQFIMLGMDRTGSYALSENQSDLFMISLVGWIESIAETINRFAVEPLLRLNGDFDNIDVLPSIEPIRPLPPNLTELSSYLFKLARAGLLVPDQELADFLRRLAFLRERVPSKEIQVVDPQHILPSGVPSANPMGSVHPTQQKDAKAQAASVQKFLESLLEGDSKKCP